MQIIHFRCVFVISKVLDVKNRDHFYKLCSRAGRCASSPRSLERNPNFSAFSLLRQPREFPLIYQLTATRKLNLLHNLQVIGRLVDLALFLGSNHTPIKCCNLQQLLSAITVVKSPLLIRLNLPLLIRLTKKRLCPQYYFLEESLLQNLFLIRPYPCKVLVWTSSCKSVYLQDIALGRGCS